jgi:hypothetical protein
LRDVEIVTTKNQYLAGETVEGQVIVKCNKEFEYNAIHLTFTGRERTEIVVSNGDSSTTYKDERVYFTNRQDFEGKGVMAVGETYFPFQFRLPNDVPCSYSGKCGWIEYTLKGVVEVTLARDPTRQIAIEVRQPMKDCRPQFQSKSVGEEDYPVLDVEVEEDSVYLGDPIRLRFRVVPDVKIRGVRAELQAEEYSVAKRQKRKTRQKLGERFIDEREVGRGLWMNVELETDDSMPVSFDREIVRNETSVKVTLDIPWKPDTWVVIPVRLGHCAGGPGTRETSTSGFSWSIK